MAQGLHKIVSTEETIVAIATPLGRSGIGVVRLSGALATEIPQRFFKAHSPGAGLEHRRSVVGSWLNVSGVPIDETIVTLFRAPHSYTGEDVIEISAHGNPLILRQIVETAREAGARIATPGEFTLRAVIHGKMDLIQAEAVREFIDAQTEEQAKTAFRQMEGSVSKRVRPAKEELLDIIAHLEAGIDFGEDDGTIPENRFIAEKIERAVGTLDSLDRTFGYGKLLVQGLQVTILGKPNVGKSSLFNRLVAADRAIVTEIPGTTRDMLTETVSVGGVPLRFADTAGVRETTDRVESIGVSRTLEALTETSLALIVLDGSIPMDSDDLQVLSKTKILPRLVVINKSDLPLQLDPATLDGLHRVHMSAMTGEGVEQLQEAIRTFLLDQKSDLSDDLVLTSARQHEAISKALSCLRVAFEALGRGVPHEMILLDLYQTLSALDELTGEIVTDDILDRIFSTFCVGK